MRITAENYDALKAFWVLAESWIHPQYAQLTLDQGNPFKTLDMFEIKSKSMARQGLQSAIGDLLEETMNFSREQIRGLDTSLAEAGLLTFTAVRLLFWKRVRSILQRGRVRSENEYYLLRNVVEGMEGDEQSRAWEMLGNFELKGLKA